MTPSDEKMWTVLIESQEFSVKALERLIATASPEQKKLFQEAAQHFYYGVALLEKASKL